MFAKVQPRAKHDAIGNGLKDEEANLAMARHPQPPSWLAARVATEVAGSHKVIFHATRVLPLWPKVSKEELQTARAARVARVRRWGEHDHCWVCVGSRWHCQRCFAATFPAEGVQQRRKE